MAPGVRSQIEAGAGALGLALPAAAIDALATLVAELQRWSRKINLTAIRDPHEMVTGHILDSLAIAPYLRGKRVLDIGTGAGFPGLPLAIASPDREFVLLDSSGKKLAFVRHMIGALALGNVDTVKARAEDYAPATRFDTVTARALASIPRLVELSAHLVGEDGQMLALKGKPPAEELDAASRLEGWRPTLHVLTVPGLEAHARHVVRLHRT